MERYQTSGSFPSNTLILEKKMFCLSEVLILGWNFVVITRVNLYVCKSQ